MPCMSLHKLPLQAKVCDRKALSLETCGLSGVPTSLALQYYSSQRWDFGFGQSWAH